MKKVELLSPAGNMMALKSAIYNGADAVYLSGKEYGARKFAQNFSVEEIAEAIKFAHLYGVKIYITVNTMIYESEVEDLIRYIETIHKIGVDAVIMQDIGLISLVTRKFPNLEVHASTQAHNHNKEGISFLKSLGVSRVVLARELSLKEIQQIDCDIEKEVFIHGALCVSYSGECLFSSLALNRSGNRGECAGLCRLPYELYENENKVDTDGNYLLSMKELNTTNFLKEILSSGVDSLKIEGRMKSPEYVGYVTKIYRKLIDSFYEGKDLSLSNEEKDNLKVLYNREFTKGFINGEDKNTIVNAKSGNHQGIVVGKILSCDKKIKIKLLKDLNQGDGLRLPNNEGMIANFIYNEQGLLINKGQKDEIIYLDNKVKLNKLGNVLKTLDSKLIAEVSCNVSKKIPVSFDVVAKVGCPLTISITDKNKTFTQKGNILSKALKVKTTKEELKDKLNKLGNTPFSLNNINVFMDDNVFIPMKELNSLRRALCEELEIFRSSNKKEIIIKDVESNLTSMNLSHEISFLVRNENQLKYLLNKDVIIYVEDFLLYRKYKRKNVFYKTNRVSNNFPLLESENLLASELGAIVKYGNNNKVYSDYYLNVSNSYSLKLLADLKVQKIGLSVELDDKMLSILFKSLKNKGDKLNIELLIYGRPELMIMKYCPISTYREKNNRNCIACHNNKYYLKGQNKESYPLITRNCFTKLLHSKNINLISKIDYYKSLGITNFRLDLYDETIDQIASLLKELNV